MSTVIEKLNKKFLNCKNHRDFYMYYQAHRNELMDEEKEQIVDSFNEGMNLSEDYFDPYSKLSEAEEYYNNQTK